MTRAERHAQIKALRADGLTFREIGEQLGIARSTAVDVYYDPTGEAARNRKRRYERACLGCGRIINPNGIRSEVVRCFLCHNERQREQSRRWIVESMQEWAEMFGAPPSAVDWNPAMARAKYGAWKAERYEQTGRAWPSIHLVQDNFGSWNEGLIAAGFTPLAPDQHWIGHAGVVLMEQDREVA